MGDFKMKTAILLGAGSSVAAGFPSTEVLTGRILSGNGVCRHTDETYSINDNRPTDQTSRYVTCLLNLIHGRVRTYFEEHCSAWHVSYEDVYNIIDQVYEEEFGESENPAICNYIDSLRSAVGPLTTGTRMGHKDLLRESRNYIADVVWSALSRTDYSSDHLKTLEAACKTNFVSSISTLCHDTHVEAYLEGHGVSLNDGFSDEECGVRYWNNDFSSSDKISFLKLHGSVNWFRFRLGSSRSRYDDRIGVPLELDVSHHRTKGKDGEFQASLGDRPLLLIGTFNKIPDYTRGIFHELHCQFRQILLGSTQLLICGYSFGDKGINTAIIEWYYAERGRRLLIIHPNSEELVGNARGAIRNKWDEWVESGGVRLICKNFEDVEKGELLGCLKK